MQEHNIQNKYTQLESQKREIQNKLTDSSLNRVDRRAYQESLRNIETQQRVLSSQSLQETSREQNIQNKYTQLESQKREIQNKLTDSSLNRVDRRAYQETLRNIETQQSVLSSQNLQTETEERNIQDKYTQLETKERNIQNKYNQLESQKREIQNRLTDSSLNKVDQQAYQENLRNIETQQRVLNSQNVWEMNREQEINKERSIQNKYTQLESQKQEIQNRLTDSNLSDVDRQAYQENIRNIELQQHVIGTQQDISPTKVVKPLDYLPQDSYAREFLSPKPSFFGAPIAPQVAEESRQQIQNYNSSQKAMSMTMNNTFEIDARGGDSEEIATKAVGKVEEKMKKVFGNSFKELAHNTDSAEGI